MMHHCDRCGRLVDDSAYQQKEWSSWGGGRIRVNAYYCQSCHGLLGAVGAGEYSGLQERAGRRESYEPDYKREDDDEG